MYIYIVCDEASCWWCKDKKIMADLSWDMVHMADDEYISVFINILYSRLHIGIIGSCWHGHDLYD